jgi:hypothetical protein
MRGRNMDFAVIGVTLGLAALTWGLVLLCERL